MTDERGGSKEPVRAVISRHLDERIRKWASAQGHSRSDSIAFLLAAGLEIEEKKLWAKDAAARLDAAEAYIQEEQRTAEEVMAAHRKLLRLQKEHGQRKGSLMYVTGASAEKIDELGGIMEEENNEHDST